MMKKLALIVLLMLFALSALCQGESIIRPLRLVKLIAEANPNSVYTKVPFFNIDAVVKSSNSMIYLMGRHGSKISIHTAEGDCKGIFDPAEYFDKSLEDVHLSQLRTNHDNDLLISTKYPQGIIKISSENKLNRFLEIDYPVSSFDVNQQGDLVVSLEGADDKGFQCYLFKNDGKTKLSFGEIIPIKSKRPDYYYESQVVFDDDGNVLQVFNYFPIIRKYSADGKLIFEKEIDLSGMGSVAATFWKNYDFNYPNNRTENGWIQFCQRVDYYKGKLYILLADSILELSKEGRLTRVFKVVKEQQSARLIIHDMKVDPVTGYLLLAFTKGSHSGVGLFKREGEIR